MYGERAPTSDREPPQREAKDGTFDTALLSTTGLRLERDARAKLTAPGFHGDTITLGVVVDLSEIGTPKRLARNAEARVVQRVHPVGPQLQANPFSELEVLSEGQVENGEAWTPQRIPALVAEGKRKA